MGVQIPHGKGQFWGLSGQQESMASLCCDVYSKRDHSVLNNGIRAQLLHLTAMLPTGWCCIILSAWTIRPMKCGFFCQKILWPFITLNDLMSDQTKNMTTIRYDTAVLTCQLEERSVGSMWWWIISVGVSRLTPSCSIRRLICGTITSSPSSSGWTVSTSDSSTDTLSVHTAGMTHSLYTQRSLQWWQTVCTHSGHSNDDKLCVHTAVTPMTTNCVYTQWSLQWR